ncbi:unnamed protein product [Thelazia callipaeda]|uniref:Uncharacterized protein n=1 Tax=Thelazia callipaeda TaxID=103827 RepID=A0A0N5CTB3_THECL|nr:unnamed protein product [Thelazia callipaeda]
MTQINNKLDFIDISEDQHTHDIKESSEFKEMSLDVQEVKDVEFETLEDNHTLQDTSLKLIESTALHRESTFIG